MLDKIMYKKTNPQQKLFDLGTQLSPSLRNRLESSGYGGRSSHFFMPIDWGHLHYSLINSNKLQGTRHIGNEGHP